MNNFTLHFTLLLIIEHKLFFAMLWFKERNLHATCPLTVFHRTISRTNRAANRFPLPTTTPSFYDTALTNWLLVERSTKNKIKNEKHLA